MNEQYNKKLEKNYGKVLKTEMDYVDKQDKILSSYDRKLKSLATESKKETKVQKDTEKRVQQETKVFLQQLKELEKEKTKKLNAQNKESKKQLKEECDALEKAFKQTIAELNDQKRTYSTENTAAKREAAKESKKSQTSIAGKEKRAVKRFEGMKQKEKAEIKDRKKQAEEKINTLQTERDNLVKELSDAAQLEISSLYEVISFRRAKTDESLTECEAKHSEIIIGIDKEEEGATSAYNAKVLKNEHALEEKVARRNKFLQKADQQGDMKNVKLQNREIKSLEQSSEKELKAIKQEYDRLIKDIELKRTLEERRYLEEIAEKERDFAQFKQEQLWRIELNQIQNSEQITIIKLETEKKLYAETTLLHQIDMDVEVELGRLEKEKQIAINDLQDLAIRSSVAFEKERDSKALEFDIKMALNDRDSKVAEYNKDIEINRKNAAFDCEVVEYEIAQQLMSEELQYKTTKQIEEEMIELHKNDFEKQSTIRTEFSESIKELSEARVLRAKEQLEYEELEVENRIKLKVKFLEEQEAVINDDYKLLLSRIEANHKQEEAFYKSALKQIEKQETDILKKSIYQEEKEIKKLEADLANIEAENSEVDTSSITGRLQELIDVVTRASEDTQKIIRSKSSITDENIALVKSRQQKEKEDAKVLVDRELRNLKYALELLEQNKTSEIQEAKARYAKTLNVYNDLKNDVTKQTAQKKEEHIRFMNRREDYEKSILQTAKSSYDQTVDLLEETKARKISSIKDGLLIENNVLLSFIKVQNDEFSALQRETVHKKAIIHNTAETRMIERTKEHSNRIQEIERDYEKLVSKRDRDVKQNDNEFTGLLAAIEKSILVETKKYEDDRRKAQKAYEVELKKAISSINKKLDLESRLV